MLLYHIACEAVMNALKHAKATNMWLSFRKDGDEAELVLRDDGVGFDADAPEPEGHYGMTMMRERATVGGGRFKVASASGSGTTITIRFPMSLLREEGAEVGAAGSSQAAPQHPDGASRAKDETPPKSAAEAGAA